MLGMAVLLLQWLTMSVEVLGEFQSVERTRQVQIQVHDRSTATVTALKLHRLASCQHLSDLRCHHRAWVCGSWSHLRRVSTQDVATTALPTIATLGSVQSGCELAPGAWTRPSRTATSACAVTESHGMESRCISAGSCVATGRAVLPSEGHQPVGSGRRRVVRWKADDEAVVAGLDRVEHGAGNMDDDDDEPDPDHDPFTPSMPDDRHYDPHRDHRDRDHGSLGEKHLNAANVDYKKWKKKQVDKEIKRLKERKHDAVSRPEL